MWNWIAEDENVRLSKTSSSSKWTMDYHTIAIVIDNYVARLSRICSVKP